MNREEVIEGYKRDYNEELKSNEGIMSEDNSKIISEIKNKGNYVLIEQDKGLIEDDDIRTIAMKIEWNNNESYLMMITGYISDYVKEGKMITENNYSMDGVINDIKSHFDIDSDMKIYEKHYFGPVEWMGGLLPFYYTIIDEEMMGKV